MSGFSQGSVLGQVLVNIFTNDIDSEIECTLSKYADDIKLSGAVNAGRRDAIQRDLDKLEKCSYMNLKRFKKSKCKVLLLGWGNPRHKHRLGEELIESSPAEKDFGIPVDKKAQQEPAVHVYSLEGQLRLGLHQQRSGQPVEGGDCPPSALPL